MEDERNNTVEIWAKDQEFSNMPLYIPNTKNFDGRAGRKESQILVSSIDNARDGSLEITQDGILNITKGRLRINGLGTNVSTPDLDKLINTATNKAEFAKTPLNGRK